MTELRKNGRPTWQWVAGICVTALLMGVTGWASFMMAEDGRLSRRQEVHDNRIRMLDNKLTGIEATLIAVQSQLNNIHIDLRRALTRDENGRGGKK